MVSQSWIACGQNPAPVLDALLNLNLSLYISAQEMIELGSQGGGVTWESCP